MNTEHTETARQYAARRSAETAIPYAVWQAENGTEYAAMDVAGNQRTYREVGACKVATYARGRLLA